MGNVNFFLKKLSKNLDGKQNCYTFASVLKTASRGGAVVARWAHNPKAGGSIPSPATKERIRESSLLFFCLMALGLKKLAHLQKLNQRKTRQSQLALPRFTIVVFFICCTRGSVLYPRSRSLR